MFAETSVDGLDVVRTDLEQVSNLLSDIVAGIDMLRSWTKLTHRQRMYLIARQRRTLRKLVKESIKENKQHE